MFEKKEGFNFPIITSEIQKAFEQTAFSEPKDTTPELCGFYGRACRQLNKEEGANRTLCMGCPLKAFAETKKKNATPPHWYINCDGYYIQCSVCKKEPEDGKMTETCPHCGAKMDLSYRSL